MELDKTDRKILEVLQQQGRISINDLAAAVGLSATPCTRRLKRLEEDGVITGYAAILDQATLGLDLTAIIGITMDRHTPERFENFEQHIFDFPEVLECSIVTGQSADYLVKVAVKDMQHYEALLLKKLSRIEGVTGLHSSFVLRKVVADQRLPIEQQNTI